MKLRRLTPDGIAQFTAYLTNLKVEPTLTPPKYLLSDGSTSEPVADVEIEEKAFANRLEAAQYLDQVLSRAAVLGIERDTGLWAWFALFYFDQLCSPGKIASRKPGELARYVPAMENFQRFYRHLLLGPYLIFRAHIDQPHRAICVLASALSAPGDIVEQLASRQELITNRSVMSVVTRLYIDSTTNKLKRGSGGRGGGSARRLADILNQFDLTYDLYAVGEAQLFSLLPGEFSRFQN